MIENYQTLRCYTCTSFFKNDQEKKECVERIHPNELYSLLMYASLVEINSNLYPILCSY